MEMTMTKELCILLNVLVYAKSGYQWASQPNVKRVDHLHNHCTLHFWKKCTTTWLMMIGAFFFFDVNDVKGVTMQHEFQQKSYNEWVDDEGESSYVCVGVEHLLLQWNEVLSSFQWGSVFESWCWEDLGLWVRSLVECRRWWCCSLRALASNCHRWTPNAVVIPIIRAAPIMLYMLNCSLKKMAPMKKANTTSFIRINVPKNILVKILSIFLFHYVTWTRWRQLNSAWNNVY